MRIQEVRSNEHTEFYLVKLLEAFAHPEQGCFDRPLALEYLESFHSPLAHRYGKPSPTGRFEDSASPLSLYVMTPPGPPSIVSGIGSSGTLLFADWDVNNSTLYAHVQEGQVPRIIPLRVNRGGG